MRLIAIFLAAAACGQPPHTDVCVNVNSFSTADFPGDFTPEDMHEIMVGVGQWAVVGFAIHDACADDMVKLSFRRQDIPVEGLRGGNRIIIDDDVFGLDLRQVATHEAGHALLDTGDHLPAGFNVMSSPSYYGSWLLTDEDIEFALDHCAKCRDWWAQ